MDKPERVFLIGPMGSGKTAVGRRLADMLDYEFIDADHYIEEQTGVDVAYIFEKESEAGFRIRECEAIAKLTQMNHIVLATGGGAVLDEQNREHLRARGLVVYLKASVDQQYARTRQSQTRPLLQNDNPRARLEELLEQRGPLYEAIADVHICTDRRYVKSVTREIYRHVTEHGATPDAR